MTMYATLEEAIDAAREEFLADNPGIDAEDANVQQFNAQKYVLQDGDIMWQVEFFADEGEEGECLPMLSGEAAQSVFDGDYDEIEIRQEWQIKDRDITPGGVTHIPLHTGIILVAMPLPRYSATNNAATATQQGHHDAHHN